nr:PAS domain-containing sensor histidine kinase [Aliiroseovarius subalbicans]
MEAVFRHLQDEVYIYSHDGRSTFIFANQAACKRCGWETDEPPDVCLSEVSDKITPRHLARHLRPLREGETDVVRAEFQIDNKPVEVTTHIAATHDGKSVFVSVMRDKTQGRANPDDEWGAISELSHEMRTPLTSIKGAIRLLESNAVGELSKGARDVLEIASRNSDRLLAMVDRVLDFSRVSSGKIDKDAGPIDLVKLLSSAASTIEGYGFQYGVTVQVEDVPQTALVTGNTEQLTSVLTNLLSNAIKHTPKGSKVTASISERDAYWRVSVFDTGPGIPESSRSKIFESYVRAGVQPGVKSRGTGLGLAITKKIVLLHNGRIDYTPRDGGGTEFFFDIPRLVT